MVETFTGRRWHSDDAPAFEGRCGLIGGQVPTYAGGRPHVLVF